MARKAETDLTAGILKKQKDLKTQEKLKRTLFTQTKQDRMRIFEEILFKTMYNTKAKNSFFFCQLNYCGRKLKGVLFNFLCVFGSSAVSAKPKTIVFTVEVSSEKKHCSLLVYFFFVRCNCFSLPTNVHARTYWST